MTFADFLKDYGVLATALSGVVGYFIKSVHDRKQQRRREPLDLLNKRIEEFYGPLYFRVEAGQRACLALLKKPGKDSVEKDATEDDLKEWRAWVVNVFHPGNLQIEKIIIEKSYLIVEDRIPDCLVAFITHFSGYKVLIDKWNNKDFDQNFSAIDFPKNMKKYVHEAYRKLKSEQLQLINK